MPRKPRYKRPYKKRPRRYQTKSHKDTSHGIIRSYGSSMRSPLGDRFSTNLRYHDQIEGLDAGASGYAELAYRANSINDPYYATGGHQPRGHDQLNTMFGRYIVNGCKMAATFVNTDTTYPQLVGLAVTKFVPGTFTSSRDIMEQCKYVSKVLTPQGGSADVATLYIGANILKELDVTDKFNTDDDTAGSNPGAAFGSNPTKQLYFIMFTQSVGSTSDTAKVDIMVQLDYNVTAFKPNAIAEN